MPAISPTSSSMPCCAACSCICAKSQRPSASSTPMPAPAAMTLPARRPARRGEWRDGIGRLRRARARERRAERCSRPISMRSQRSIPAATLKIYPGSPLLAQALLRPQDRLIACELEPQAAAALRTTLRGDAARQGDRDRRLDRADRLCAAEGAARPRADRSAVRAAGRIFAPGCRAWRRRTANGRPASTCSGIRSRTRAEVAAFARSLAGSASRKCCAWN